MLSRFIVWVFLPLATFGSIQAQEPICAILVGIDTGREYSLALYRSENGVYEQTSTVAPELTYSIWNSDLSPDRQMLAVSEIGVYDAHVRLFDLSPFAPRYVTTLPPSDLQLVLRHPAWSNRSNKLLLHNTFGNRNDELYVYDLEAGTYASFPAYLQVFAAAWSPDDGQIAFVAYEYHYLDSPENTGNALYISPPVGISFEVVSLPETHPMQFLWLSESEFVFKICTAQGAECQIQLIDLETGQNETLLTGDYTPETYSPGTNNLVLSRRPYSDGLFIFNLEDRQLSLLNQITYLLSLPSMSRDGRFVAYMGQANGMPQLFVTDVFVFSTHSLSIQAPPDLPAVITDWHPASNQFLYEDAGTIYIYDAESDTTEGAVSAKSGERFGIPRWVCLS